MAQRFYGGGGFARTGTGGTLCAGSVKMGQYERRYLQVEADFLPDGKVIPKVLYWENEDGRVLPFSIDRILDIERGACLKAGGFGLRYCCLIHGKRRELFLQEDNRWFVAVKSYS